MNPHPSHPAGKRLAAVGRRCATALTFATALTGAGATALVLLPPVSWSAWQYALLALEFSLLFAALAAVGLSASLLARGPARVIAAAANGAVLVAALVPPAAIWSTARDEGIPLDLGAYTAGLSTSTDREPETHVYLRTGDSPVGDPDTPEDLVLDVWRPAEHTDRDLLPIVVNVHGGAEDLPQSLLPRWDTWIADRGYVVFDADYRHFPDGDWSVPVSDVKCAIGWARAHAEEHGADPDRVAVTGQSAGGLLALLAAYTTDEEIAPSCEGDSGVDAAVAWYSASDGTASAPEVPWRQRLSPLGEELHESSVQMMGGTVEELPEEYALASPLEHVSPDTPPTLLVMPGHDLFLDPEDNRRFAARLDEAGVPHEHLEIPWAEHMFDLNWGGFASQVTRHELEEFLGEHLAP
ncbi:alpha/beta hydrolase [Nocardiopsis algeriensis]|uniref:Acetyl esterase/lipase n=1 Tax=Nocardiopsis algeriensis TaxID=1478215 RepID=A0A841IKB4_9ACTN|nr:alpha/beta hydrolase [Nocardiopsis algeriensis]MBB6118404.1 acetyl esterase/lipase [Nocardiopsis algeriensis]